MYNGKKKLKTIFVHYAMHKITFIMNTRIFEGELIVMFMGMGECGLLCSGDIIITEQTSVQH